MHLVTNTGKIIYFNSDKQNNCSNCEYRGKTTFFRKILKCQMIDGLKIYNPNYGRCSIYKTK